MLAWEITVWAENRVAISFSYQVIHRNEIMMSVRHIFCQLFPLFSDHCSSGGDAEKRARTGRSPEEAGSDPTAAVQVLAQRTEGGWGLIGWQCRMCTTQMRPSYSGEMLPMYSQLLSSHLTEEYTALETGLFDEKNKCLCSVVYLFACMCVWRVYVFVSEWHWHMKKVVTVVTISKSRQFDKVVW